MGYIVQIVFPKEIVMHSKKDKYSYYPKYVLALNYAQKVGKP